MTPPGSAARSPIARELFWTRAAGLVLLTAGLSLALYALSGLAFVAALMAAFGGAALGIYHGMKP